MAGNIIEFPGTAKRDKVQFHDILVSLDESDIWREVLVPSDFPLPLLADAIIDLFEWSGRHYWYFELPEKKTFYDDPATADDPIEPAPGQTRLMAEDATVVQLLPRKGSEASFLYDFGDGWQITLHVQDTLDEDSYPFPIVPMCVDGEFASPIEDVGGVGGWERFCEAMDDPDDPQHDELREWAGFGEDEPFIEEYFSLREVNAMFALDRLDGSQSALPDDIDELKDTIVALTAEIAAYEANEILLVGNMMGAMAELGDMSPEDIVRQLVLDDE